MAGIMYLWNEMEGIISSFGLFDHKNMAFCESVSSPIAMKSNEPFMDAWMQSLCL